jgi:uncharacterized membrane protein
MLVLLGIVVLVVGFALRFNPLLVVVAAALLTGVLGAVASGAPLEPEPLGRALLHTVGQLGAAYNKNRYITLVWMILPLIGLLEREGLQERARELIGRIHAATVGRLLIVYFLVRQLTSAVGLVSMLGQAQTVRPLVAPMAEGALEQKFGPAPDKTREKVRAFAAATDNVALFYGEDMFIAIGAVLLIVGTMEGLGVKVQPIELSVWAIPTGICALVIHGVRLLRLDGSLKRQLGGEK